MSEIGPEAGPGSEGAAANAASAEELMAEHAAHQPPAESEENPTTGHDLAAEIRSGVEGARGPGSELREIGRSAAGRLRERFGRARSEGESETPAEPGAAGALPDDTPGESAAERASSLEAEHRTRVQARVDEIEEQFGEKFREIAASEGYSKAAEDLAFKIGTEERYQRFREQPDQDNPEPDGPPLTLTEEALSEIVRHAASASERYRSDPDPLRVIEEQVAPAVGAYRDTLERTVGLLDVDAAQVVGYGTKDLIDKAARFRHESDTRADAPGASEYGVKGYDHLANLHREAQAEREAEIIDRIEGARAQVDEVFDDPELAAAAAEQKHLHALRSGERYADDQKAMVAKLETWGDSLRGKDPGLASVHFDASNREQDVQLRDMMLRDFRPEPQPVDAKIVSRTDGSKGRVLELYYRSTDPQYRDALVVERRDQRSGTLLDLAVVRTGQQPLERARLRDRVIRGKDMTPTGAVEQQMVGFRKSADKGLDSARLRQQPRFGSLGYADGGVASYVTGTNYNRIYNERPPRRLPRYLSAPRGRGFWSTIFFSR